MTYLEKCNNLYECKVLLETAKAFVKKARTLADEIYDSTKQYDDLDLIVNIGAACGSIGNAIALLETKGVK